MNTFIPPPPTYEASSYRQLWPVVAPYVRPTDLLAACLVSQEWHRAFAPELWGNPAARFGEDIDEVYCKSDGFYKLFGGKQLIRIASLIKFRDALPQARLSVRNLTHTFELSRSSYNAQVSEAIQSQWLRVLLDQLPSLRTLLLSKSTLIDHETLSAIHFSPGNPVQNTNIYSLNALDLSENYNLTSRTVTAALQHFPELLYLNLSSWTGVRQPEVLRQIGNLAYLKILKLSRCGLKNEDVKNIVLPSSLLSLDVSLCLLTHSGLEMLLKKLPRDNYKAPASKSNPRTADNTRIFRMLSGNIDGFVITRLKTEKRTDFILDLPTSFCELSLRGNEISIKDITETLECLTIDYLDCGILSMSPSEGVRIKGASELRIHPRIGSQRLDPMMFMKAFQCLRSLRIHHSLITDYLFTTADHSTVYNKTEETIIIDELMHGDSSSTENLGLEISTNSEDMKKAVTKERERLRKRRPTARFQPSMMPNLKILTLTDMPSKTTMDLTVQSFILLIQELAEEESFAVMEDLGWIEHSRKSPGTPLKLQKLIFEMAPDEDRANARHNQKSSNTSTPRNLTKSTAEDLDAERFLLASENDFSFFTKEDNAGVSRANPNRNNTSSAINPADSDNWIAIIPAIAKFRKESKTQYEALATNDCFNWRRLLCGYWTGEVQVVRSSSR